MMKFTVAILISVCICTSGAPLRAQATQPLSNTCETDPGFRAFDFWLGRWTVMNRTNGQLAGTNNISKVEGGCALREEWTNTKGGTGQSLTFYNPATGAWRQIWVSAGSGGYSIDIDGTPGKGLMKLQGTIYYYGQNTTAPFRATWKLQENGTVRQLFEQYSNDTDSWQIWFDGLYEPKK